MRFQGPAKRTSGFIWFWALEKPAAACVFRGLQNAHQGGPSAAARAACSGSLAMMHQANASRLQLRAKRCNLNIPFRTYGLRTHDFSTYESYVRTSVPMPLRSCSCCRQKVYGADCPLFRILKKRPSWCGCTQGETRHESNDCPKVYRCRCNE